MAVDAPAAALKFLEDTTHDPDKPVVLFALDWCTFCWAVKKMFAEFEIPYHSVNLDSVEFQENNRGGDIRKAIEAKTGLKTIPQIYVGGTHIGGATELFDACKDGSLGRLLDENNVAWNPSTDADPHSFLPF